MHIWNNKNVRTYQTKHETNKILKHTHKQTQNQTQKQTNQTVKVPKRRSFYKRNVFPCMTASMFWVKRPTSRELSHNSAVDNSRLIGLVLHNILLQPCPSGVPAFPCARGNTSCLAAMRRPKLRCVLTLCVRTKTVAYRIFIVCGHRHLLLSTA